MKPHLPKLLRFLASFGFAATLPVARASEPTASEEKTLSLPSPEPSFGSRLLEAILPKSMQKRPLILFNAITEMSPEGRTRRQPTPERPMYYLMHTTKFVQTGWMVSAGEKPPPVAELEAAMRKALAGNGYLDNPPAGQRPELLIVFNFGSHGTDPESAVIGGSEGSPPVTAGELLPIVVSDLALFKDVIARATLVAGESFARELKAALENEARNIQTNRIMERTGSPIHLPVSPEFGSPFQDFVRSGKNSSTVEHLAEMAFHTCYFVMASAYDYDAMEKNQKRLLWRTKMTVEAQGVSMEEIMNPLIANTGSFLGREMTEAAVVKKRISREGKVDVGTPTVVGEAARSAISESIPESPTK
ncbi:MAG: hypothetical protein ABIZ81_10110 [Opitutaceae bacterium]